MLKQTLWLDGLKGGTVPGTGKRLLGVVPAGNGLVAVTQHEQLLLTGNGKTQWSQPLRGLKMDSVVRFDDTGECFAVATRESEKATYLQVHLTREATNEPIFSQKYTCLVAFELKKNFLFVFCEFGVQIWILSLKGTGANVKYATLGTQVNYLFESGVAGEPAGTLHLESNFGVLTVVSPNGFLADKIGFTASMFLLHNVSLGPFRSFKVRLSSPPLKLSVTGDLSTLIFLSKNSKMTLCDAYSGKTLKKFTKKLTIYDVCDFSFLARDHLLVLARQHNMLVLSQPRQFDILMSISYPATLPSVSRLHLRVSEEARQILVQHESVLYHFK